MATIGIIGAGEVGSQIARAAIANGYRVVIANSRGPETLARLVAELGPDARAATAADAAEAGDFVVVAVPLKLANDMPVEQLAGKIVLDTNNYMPWRDGRYAEVDVGEKTEHELRQEQLPTSKVAKAFTHIQAPRLFLSARHLARRGGTRCRYQATTPRRWSWSRGFTISSASIRQTTVHLASPGGAAQVSPHGTRTNIRRSPS